MVRPIQILDGVMMYAENEVLPTLNLDTVTKKVMAGAVLAYAYKNAGAKLGALINNEVSRTIGLVDENGMVDADGAAGSLKESIRKNGDIKISLPLLADVDLGAEDIDKVLEYIKKSEAQ